MEREKNDGEKRLNIIPIEVDPEMPLNFWEIRDPVSGKVLMSGRGVSGDLTALFKLPPELLGVAKENKR